MTTGYDGSDGSSRSKYKSGHSMKHFTCLLLVAIACVSDAYTPSV